MKSDVEIHPLKQLSTRESNEHGVTWAGIVLATVLSRLQEGHVVNAVWFRKKRRKRLDHNACWIVFERKELLDTVVMHFAMKQNLKQTTITPGMPVTE